MRFSSSEREKLIITKGTICCNCCSYEGNNIIFHHIVPLSLGGTNNITNIVPICEKCHNLIHHQYHNDRQQDTHSDLIKAGMQRAKEDGKIIGRKALTIEMIPDDFKKIHYPKIKDKEITIAELSRQLGMSRTTIYKYIKIIEKI